MPLIHEGKVFIEASLEEEKNISKKLPVFYNPNMKLNRDINVALLNAINKSLEAIDLLAGSGVRGIRLIKETNCIKSMHFEDIKTSASIEKNCKRNKINNYVITNAGANTTLLQSKGFDYIDIDPFGSPISYLDAACKRIRKDGILAVTATDTSALCGTYINACRRKYWATPLHTAEMHEVGVRILIRKVQLIAAQYEKIAIPIFSHASRHYMRVYFHIEKGKKKIDVAFKLHNTYKSAGPMWLGQLWDKTLVRKMSSSDPATQNLIDVIKNEAMIDTVGFYDLHAIAKREKLRKLPSTESILTEIRKTVPAVPTHFSKYGIRTTHHDCVELVRTLST